MFLKDQTPAPGGDGAPARSGVAGTAVAIVLLLVGLPVAVWLDLSNLTERSLVAQATDFNHAIDAFRGYYSLNVVGRVIKGSPTKVQADYHDVPGAIPVPATLSLELGPAISQQDGSVQHGERPVYRFFSDHPFAKRAPHEFDTFESEALETLRRNPDQVITEVSGSITDRRVRLITPIVMGAQCVSCHNSHPESLKRDWKIGDVRGIEEIDLERPIGTSVLAFKYLLSYFACAAFLGLTFIVRQRRQATLISRVNGQLAQANAFFASIAAKLGHYLSPQLYRSIFVGDKDVKVATERKKLTIFFSDIVDFTATTERLEPEELTALLNDYLTEMAAIAARHGGTLDKFIGDAIVIFFGDPETRGVEADAEACLRMAVEMQRRLSALNAKWRRNGIERPFRVRMGINTGFCDVGNFGSEDRIEYTIIGAEANLSARLQTIAEAGGIVLSYETYALVRDVVRAHPLSPITVKGVSRTIVPYAVDGLVEEEGQREQVVSAHTTGLDLFLDAAAIEDKDAAHAVVTLRAALAALEARRGPDPG